VAPPGPALAPGATVSVPLPAVVSGATVVVSAGVVTVVVVVVLVSELDEESVPLSLLPHAAVKVLSAIAAAIAAVADMRRDVRLPVIIISLKFCVLDRVPMRSTHSDPKPCLFT
jgi:hypothetical protein